MKKQTLLFLVIINTIIVFAQTPGTLDTEFSDNGIVLTDHNSCDNFGLCSVIQDDSKILVAGYSDLNNTKYATFARYLPDGSLDNSFGAGGIASFLPILGHNEWINDMVLQPDGKILAIGYNSDSDFNSDMIVMRLNSDGSLDNTFNGTGKNQVSFGSSYNSFGYSLALQDNGKIIAVGYAWDMNNDSQCAFCRLNTDGTLDNSFGTGGRVIMNLANMQNYTNNVSVQGDKILIGGVSYLTGQAFITLSRYSSDGILDSGFGQNGIVTVEFEIDYLILKARGDMMLDSQNRILYGTFVSGIQSTDFALFRFMPDGAPDNSFGDFGLSIVDMLDNSEINTLALQSDGKIIAGGFQYVNSSANFALVRFLDNGDPDLTFGDAGTGIVITNPSPLGSGYQSAITSVGIQADGKIVASGYSTNFFGNFDFASARYFSGVNTGVNSYENKNIDVCIWPNPIVETSLITFDLKEPGRVKAELINTTGDILLTVTNKYYPNGSNNIRFDSSGLPAGIYFIRLTAGDNSSLQKILKL